jgi:MFS family permease
MSWRRNLLVMWVCQFIAMLGMSLVVPFLPLFVRELGINNVQETAKWSGFAFSGPFLLSFFLVPFWGFLGDRYGSKLMVIRAIFGLAIAQFLVGLSQNVYQLIVTRMIQGAISGFLPASLALVSVNTPREKTGFALGILQTATSAGTVLGPFFGGTLADTIGIRPIFYLVSALCTLSGLLVIILVKENKVANSNQDKYRMKQNFQFVYRFNQIKILLFLIVIAQTGIGFIQPLFALYVETLNIDLNYIATSAGVLYGIMGVFTIVAAPFWGKLSEKYAPNHCCPK